jgi:hypothetical protein
MLKPQTEMIAPGELNGFVNTFGRKLPMGENFRRPAEQNPSAAI